MKWLRQPTNSSAIISSDINKLNFMAHHRRLRYALFPAVCVAITICGSQATADDGGVSFNASPQAATIKKYAYWMSRLPDDVVLSALSLPGTHDSCALHDGLSFGFAKCQTWSLADQLKAGVRFIDIRCRHMDNRFFIYHGIIDQRMTFEEVRDVCQKFLEDHPTECIVMSVKEESSSVNTTRSFAATFSEATANDGHLWHVNHSIPKLNSVRKRIVLIDRVGKLGGLPWSKLNRQDDYQALLATKSKLITEQFEKAVRGERRQWFVNFCSGTLPKSLVTPKLYAQHSNSVALRILRTQASAAPVRIGTVVVDFPSEELLERIVEANFPPQKPE